MKENKEALEHVKKLIEDLNNELSSSVKVEDISYSSDSLTYHVNVSINDKPHRIIFERSLIDDLNVALEKYRGTKYFNTLESNVKFAIYIELGKKGLLKDFDVSRKLIYDKREWITDYKINTSFSPEMAELFYEGLKKLLIFFNSLIDKHKSLGVGYAEIEEKKDWVQSLISYYETNGHLNSPGVGTKNLQFLKAATIMQIMYLEKIRKAEKMPTTLKEVNKKIYELVAELRKDPFLEIEPPDFIHEIAEADD